MINKINKTKTTATR